MNHGITSHLYQDEDGLHEMYFWNDRVNFGIFLPRSPSISHAIEKQLADREFLLGGVKALLEAPIAIQSMGASIYYCYPQDAMALREKLLELAKVPLDKMPDDMRRHYNGALAFAVSKLGDAKLASAERSVEKLVKEVSADAALARKLKRRRADFAPVVDALLRVGAEDAQEEAAAAAAELPKTARKTIGLTSRNDDVDLF